MYRSIRMLFVAWLLAWPLIAQESPPALEAPPEPPAPPLEAPASTPESLSGDAASPDALPADSPSSEDLRAALEALEDDFNVLTTNDGIGLTPKDDEVGFSLLQVHEGNVSIDGEVVDAEALQERVGSADGARLLALAELSGDELRDLRRPVNSDLEARLQRIQELQEQRDRELAELEALKQELEEEVRRGEDGEDGDEASRYYTQDRFSFGNSLTIDERESTNDVVVIGGSLEIDGEVLGDAVVVGGGVEVQGDVHGDLTAVGGSISIGPDAQLSGEVTSVGGTIDDPHNRTRGNSVQVELGPFDGFDSFFRDSDWWESGNSLDWDPGWWGWHWGGLFLSLFFLGIFVLWIAFLTFLNRDYVESVSRRTESEPWKAALVGLASQVLLLPLVGVISLILLISVIGIPVLIILLPVGAFLLWIFSCYGYAGVATWCGRLMQRRFDWRASGPFVLLFAGILLIEGWAVLGDALIGFSGPVQITAWLVLIMGFVLQYVVWTTGFGSVVLMAFEGRSGGNPVGSGFVPPPPGPVPSTPPVPDIDPVDRDPGDYAALPMPDDGYGTPSTGSGIGTGFQDGWDDTAPADDSTYGSPDTWDDPFAETDEASRSEEDAGESVAAESAEALDDGSEDGSLVPEDATEDSSEDTSDIQQGEAESDTTESDDAESEDAESDDTEPDETERREP